MVAPRPTHEPLPQDTLDAEIHHVQGVEPDLAGDDELPDASAGPREQALVGLLEVIPVGGLDSRAGVDVAEDVEAGSDAPEFAEVVRAAVVAVTLVFLRASATASFFFFFFCPCPSLGGVIL